jgi:hypothetical protein
MPEGSFNIRCRENLEFHKFFWKQRARKIFNNIPSSRTPKFVPMHTVNAYVRMDAHRHTLLNSKQIRIVYIKSYRSMLYRIALQTEHLT